MAIVPTSLARVSNTLRTSVTTQTLTKTQQQLLEVQNQILTGIKITTPSADPGAASIIMQLQKTLENRQAYLDNISKASGQLSQADTTIGGITDLLQQAQSVASANVGSDVTQDARTAAAAIVQSLYTQMMSLGNQQFDGVYLFGGDQSNTSPFIEAAGGMQFVGSDGQLSNAFDGSTVMSFTTAASEVFGPVSARVAGSATLAPAVTNSTRLSDLAGATGSGVRPGSIVLSDGVTSKTIDLTGADSVGDVITRINNAAVGGITAAVDPTGAGIELTSAGSDNITVGESGGGTTASDLGILRTVGAGVGLPVAGSPVGAKLTAQSPLSGINGGSLNLFGGLTIKNGPTTSTVDLSTATTVQDVLNAINNSGTGVRAEINAAGTGIDVTNTVSGAGLTIGENGGGSAAAQLGIRTFDATTSLSSLNGGKGVHLSSTGADLRITQTDGTVIDVDLSGATTVGDVLNAINTASAGMGGSVTASVSQSGGIMLTDTAGGAGQLATSSLNGSTAAADLGLTGASVAGVLDGTDVNPTYASGAFAHLANLRDALQRGDQAAITAAADALKADYDRAVRTRGMVGAKLQDLDARQSRLEDQNVATESALSSLRDTDFNEAITRFMTLQTSLQAAMQGAGKTLNLSLLDFLG